MEERTGQLDVNHATVEELQEKLPGIGKRKAESIVEYRDAVGGFTILEELKKVPGIGEGFLENNKDSICCTPAPGSSDNSPSSRSLKWSLRGREIKDETTPSRIPVPKSASVIKRKLHGKTPPCQTEAPSPEKKICYNREKERHRILPPGKEYGAIKTSSHSHDIACRKLSIPGAIPPHVQSWLQLFYNWGYEEKKRALDELIDTCEPGLVRHMMAMIEPRFQRDFISLLPRELALYVLAFLDPKDLCKAAQTCKSWQILCEDNLLWKQKCKENNIREEPIPSTVKPSSRRNRHVLSFFQSSSNQQSPSSAQNHSNLVPYKKLFVTKQRIYLNWRTKEIRTPKILKGHDDHVITCLQFNGNKIVSGSDDNTLKVWSASGRILRTLVGHTGGVWSSQLSDNVVVSGSTDRTLRVWNADSGQCIHILYGHSSTVRCMDMYKNIVVSGSRDATLRMWDIESGECLHVLVGHVAAVRCVKYDGRRVVSGAYDYLVKVWDPETDTCIHTLQGHTNRVYSLQFDGVHIVSGSLDTSIRVWHVETGQCLHTLVGHQSLTSGMELKDNILVSGNADSTVKIWDIRTGKCLATLAGSSKHQSAVTCLQFNSKFVITSSDDGTVKLWDLHTGEFVRDLVKLESGGSGGVVWRVKANEKKLVCAVGSRNGTEETKLLVLDFDVYD